MIPVRSAENQTGGTWNVVVGTYGTILHTTNGGVTFVEEEEIDEIPTSYSLSNNFPNPFNPVTTIRYQIPEVSFATLKVYDVLGSEVVRLVNEEKPAGIYEVEFSATGGATALSSGIYFYRLRVGDPSTSSGQSFVETKKMVVMK